MSLPSGVCGDLRKDEVQLHPRGIVDLPSTSFPLPTTILFSCLQGHSRIALNHVKCFGLSREDAQRWAVKGHLANPGSPGRMTIKPMCQCG